ncbi:MAG: signal peptidase [Planctomycetaceae bacterium]|nr:signal peptidase [Planctomycetaceae bacterium]
MPKYVVRYGAMRALGVFSVRGHDRLRRGVNVIARTERGLEAGEVLCVATEDALGHLDRPPQGQVLRRMSAEDSNEWLHIQTQGREEFETCKRHVSELGLQMELVDLEHIFGGERVVVYYLSEERVDFRELVRKLASEFQTRIEMRQIGVRDEAKLLADYGDCGKPVCCNTHLSAMPPVSMKMAKLQKATLDPTKISGRCGRLKCCLRYEYDTYVDIQRELPPVGSDVVTNNGRARVISQSILAEQLMVEMEDHRRVLIGASEILTVLRRGSGKSKSSKSKVAAKGQTKTKKTSSDQDSAETES